MVLGTRREKTTRKPEIDKIPAHEVLGFRSEQCRALQDVDRPVVATADEDRRRPVAEQAGGDKVRLGEVGRLEGQRIELDRDEQHDRILRPAGKRIRKGEARGAAGAAKSEQRQAPHAGLQSERIDHRDVEAGRCNAARRDEHEVVDVVAFDAGAVQRLLDGGERELPGPVEIEVVLVLEAVLVLEPDRFDAKMPLIDEGALEDLEVLVDVVDLAAEVFAGQLACHVLRHDVGRYRGADRDDAGHAALVNSLRKCSARRAMRQRRVWRFVPRGAALSQRHPGGFPGQAVVEPADHAIPSPQMPPRWLD